MCREWLDQQGLDLDQDEDEQEQGKGQKDIGLVIK